MTGGRTRTVVGSLESPVNAKRVQEILEQICQRGAYRAVLLDREGRCSMEVSASPATPASEHDERLDEQTELSAPVLVNGATAATVQATGPSYARARLERAVQAAAGRLSDAWIAAEELDSLAGEIIHAYEELHLLYELGSSLSSELSVPIASDQILEKILNTVPAARAELRLVEPGTPVFTRIGQETESQRTASQGGEHRLTTTLRSAGQKVGTINLIRRGGSQPFSSVESKLLDGVGTLAANAIRGVQLYGESRLQAEALQASESYLRAIMDRVADGILTVDAQGVIESANPAAERIFGDSSARIIGQRFQVLMDPTYYRTYGADLHCYLRTGQSELIGKGAREAVGRRMDGTTFPLEIAISEMSLNGRRLFIACVRDVTKRKQAVEALQYQALHDALTGLPNRTLLHDRLCQTIVEAEKGEHPFSLLVMDLDGFKEVNDTLGHHNGDLLLKEAGQRLVRLLLDSGTVARLGGDEFAVLLPSASDAESATSVVLRMRDALKEPFLLEGLPVEVQVSIGVALYPEHGHDAETLLRRADVAMYVAKGSTAGYVVYAPEHDHFSPSRLALTSELRQAIEHDQLVLFYQPKIDLKAGRVVGLEALVRWQHPRYGLVPPDEFIPLAERTGLIRPLTQWVLTQAVRQCQAARQAGWELPISVNLSARNLHDPQLVDTIATLLETSGVPSSLLSVEVTESTIMADAARALEVLVRLRRMGVAIAMDDFGTGYSSLAYLKRLPMNELKIDKSFVRDMTQDENDRAIVRSTIGLGHDLGLQVLAEGVEDRSTWELLASLGCDSAQGYYWSRPLPPDELARWLRDSGWHVG